MTLRNLLICKKQNQESGKICYGKNFLVELEKGEAFAVCIKCYQKHELNR